MARSMAKLQARGDYQPEQRSGGAGCTPRTGGGKLPSSGLLMPISTGGAADQGR
jgi:hypothetical protein